MILFLWLWGATIAIDIEIQLIAQPSSYFFQKSIIIHTVVDAIIILSHKNGTNYMFYKHLVYFGYWTEKAELTCNDKKNTPSLF